MSISATRRDVAGRGSGNSRNGTRTKTVLTDNAGKVEITVPRDRNGSFEPVIVAKHQRRLAEISPVVRPFAYSDRAMVSTSPCTRPLLPVYAAVFIDTRSRHRDWSRDDQAYGRRPSGYWTKDDPGHDFCTYCAPAARARRSDANRDGAGDRRRGDNSNREMRDLRSISPYDLRARHGGHKTARISVTIAAKCGHIVGMEVIMNF